MSEALSSEAAIGFRLSPQQESLWIRQAGGAVPTVQARILLEGVWEHTALERALLRLEERHENLRTTFIQVPGIPLPLQSMGEPGGLALHRVSLGVEHVEPRGEALERLAREERQRPFTLARGPLARACLVTGAPGRAVLLLTVPALCADCASMATLVRELAGLLAGEELPEAPPQYADVSEWLHEQKASEEAATASRRWEERELRALKAQRLPVEPATQEEQAGGEPVRTLLGGERLAGLRRTAERLGVGLDALLLGCWHALLWRLGGQEESVCGVVPASRGYEELDATVGLFARPVPISSPTTGGTRFPALVEKLAAALAALAEQQYLFHMARPLPEASPGRAFPITFSFFELPEALAAQGLTLSLRVLESGAEHTPLALDCVATGDGLELTLGAALPQYARQLSEQFLSVLDTVVESPDVTLDELGLARGAERERLLRTFNETRAEPPAVQLVHALFESHALRKPEALAVFVEGQRLTYGELDARANQLAHLLVERGVGPDVPVALCLERSLDFILALLGVLKAGGAYVPMDPGFPEARIQQILEDARPALVLTHRGLLSAAHVPCPVHALEELGPTLDSKPRRRPDVTCHPENLTYLIYTSGSTGRPKGVGISHRALCHYVTSVERRLQLEPDAVLGTLATVAADLGNTSLFGALCTGRGLWLCAQDDVLSPAELARRFAEQPVDCLKIVPSHLSALLASPEAEQLLPRHCLVLGGEELTGTLVARIRALRPQLRILNHYGPTETTVGALTREVPPGTGASSEGLPIGWPMDHYRAYVLDARMRPVIQGAEGELYIGGAGVARGYWNRPELTAERFLADPFSTEPGAIVYRTGDRVRQRRDGAIEFLGRMDHQVKLRGNRIELGEIEAGLRQHVHVADVVVVVREERPGDKFLAAYVVPKPGERLEAAELREHLRSRLPAFMVPAAFALLDALPLTPNGKVDRKALPHPDLKDSRRVYTPPRDELEAALLGFWEELLHCERAGIHDNFFELGGDSLLATRLMARIRTTQGVRLEVRTLFEAPTVARLAERITRERQAQGTRQMPQGPALVRVPRSGPLPLSFAQRRLWILSEIDGASAAYNIPAALRLRGALDVDALVRALQEIVRRHEALRTNFLRVGEEPVQVIAEGYTLHVPVEESREEDIVPRARAHATRPFDLATEPLFRATLLRLSPEEHVLLVCLHHIVSDGWSTGVLIRELVALYGAFREGRASPLSELPLQYADFASWQMEWLTGGELERQLAYWKKQLQGLPDLLELPSDRPRPPTQSYRGAVLPFELPEPLTERLRALSRQHEATLFITLLAAFQTLLARYTGQTDIAVGSPIAHRTHGELEGLIGCFFNTLVLRGDLSGAPDFTTLLARVKETTLAAHAHQDVPFERLVEVLQPRRSLSHSPLFQVMFILQNVPTGRLELPGLELRPVEFEMPVSKFDLTLDLTDTPQGLRGRLEYSTDLFDASTMERLSRHLRVLLEAIATDPARSVFELPLLEPREAHQQLVEWNATDLPYPREHLMPDAFEAQARRTPEATAVVLEEGLLTYGELEARSNRLAHRLRSLGVGPESRVGVCVERSLELVVSLLAVLKAGGAYIPLDPSFPTERLAYMARDGGIRVLLTQVRLEEHVPAPGVPRVRVDRPEDVASFPAEPPARALSGSNLAYVLYTSGSTGQPKGVMVEHGNVAAFFAAMDERLGREPGTWLAITSISFDISLLELLWTLTRGFKVVLFGENTAPVSSQPRASVRPLDFSLFYFASDAGEHGRDKYRLLLEGAKFADAHGFSAVWTPERHFGTFGGLYPNPAVTGAAIASITRNVGIRSGSCVLPLRDPINVAEDWSVIDNLSNGRVGLSFASGWQPTDFVFAPEKYRDRKEAMFQGLETVRRLWRGEAVKRRAGDGREVDVRTLPRPVQAELPVWITAAGNPETFRRAGKVGARLLTHLLGQSLEELEKSIALYREAWRKHGHGPGGGHVSLMLHTFVCDDDARARDLVKEPLKNYLRESVDLVRPLAAARGLDVENFSAEDLEALLDHAFQRYFETSGLFGTPERCAPLVEALKRVGVDEVACLIDFGLEADTVLAHLLHLRELKDRSQPQAGAPRDYSIPALIERHGVTHFQCTPSMAGLLVADEGAREALGRLRYMLVGGEALPVKLARELTSLVTGQVLNMYGPTETTVWSTTHRVEGGAVSIGRPIANTRVYVLDGHGQPAPVGVPGELYIGGEGVARGYLGRPELTRERFVENVLRDVPGQRLYRTGDLVRYRPDGTLDFLGRRDHQIKLNGFRIEVGEIEAVLASHAAVREAVVAPREEPSGTRRLVAWVTGSGMGRVDVGELRQLLESRLPAYMVPARFVVLDALPLTPNGKVDRNALPSPDKAPAPEQRYVAPRDEKERLLAALWRELLGREQVGVNDNFFEMGGDSIVAIQMVARANQQGLGLSPRQLFQHQTIAKLAAVARGHTSPRAEQGTLTGEVPLTPIQHWFFEQELVEPHHYNQALLLTTSRPGLDLERLARAQELLVQHHDALRLRFERRPEGWRQWFAATSPRVPVERIDLSALSEPARSQALEEAKTRVQASLDTSQGPLMRMAWLHLGADQTPVLLLVIHHLVVDGISWRILVEDLQSAYQQLGEGRAVQLPAKSSSFKDWSERLVHYAQSPELQAEAIHWRQVATGVRRLPVDLDGENTVASSRTITVELTQQESQSLLKDVPRAYNTEINDALLTALVQALETWTGEPAHLLDLEGHGREDIFQELDVSRTVGWFTSLYPVRLESGRTGRPEDDLKAVKETLRRVPGRGLGHGVLRYLGTEPVLTRALAERPAAQLLFNYLGQTDQTLPKDSLFSVIPGSVGRPHAPRQRRKYLLNVTGIVAGGHLRMDFTFSEQVHRPETIRTLADRFLYCLRTLITHCLSCEGGFTPSDFPDVELGQAELDSLLNELKAL